MLNSNYGTLYLFFFKLNSIFQMKWDKKLALYLILIYFIYALSNSLTLGDFVPPIPLFPFLIPFLGLAYFFRTPVSVISVIMLVISFGVPIQMLIFLHPFFIQVMSFSALICMLLSGCLMARYFYLNHKIYYNFLWCIVMMVSPILIIDDKLVMFVYFMTLGLSSVICLKSNSFNHSNSTSEYRLILLMGFISILYSINFISIFSI